MSAQLLVIETARRYLQGIRMVRSSAIGLVRMGLVIGLICVGVLLFHAGLFILLPWTVEAKAILGMSLGLAYVAAGALAFRVTMSEKKWMEKSGAELLLSKATGRSE